MTLIELAGVSASGEVPGTLGPDGCRWMLGYPRGWASPARRFELGHATSMPGAFVLENVDEEYRIEQPGMVIGPDMASIWAAYKRVTTNMPGAGPGRSALLVVHEPTPKALTVIQEDVIAPPPKVPVFEFVLKLVSLSAVKRAVDPVTVTLTPGQSASLTNAGTAAAYLTVEATTTGTVQLRQTVSGQVLRSKADVAAGTTFDAQTVPRSIRLAGVPVVPSPAGSPSEWLSIARESSATVTNEGTATLDVSLFDTF